MIDPVDIGFADSFWAFKIGSNKLFYAIGNTAGGFGVDSAGKAQCDKEAKQMFQFTTMRRDTGINT